MFDNSLRVPRLYKLASKVAKEVSEGRGSIKQLVYQCKHPNIKALYALVVHTFKKSDDIEKLFAKSKLLVKEPKLNPWLAKVLVTELLWGKMRLPDKSKPIKTILAYKQIFKAHLSDFADDFEEVVQVEKPRYVRVNTLKSSVNEVIDGFRNEGWVFKRHADSNDYMSFLENVTNLGPQEFMLDMHIPYLLIFPPKTTFYKHQAYKNGTIILQDKASCLPVHILNPEPGTTVLDMCAAPGMKTTQCASLMEDTGKIYAVEIGRKRYETLKKIIESSGATNVEAINADVLKISGRDYPEVEYILVDPSCSGSGITDRVEIGQQRQDQTKDRLEKLASFQLKILWYALTRFPNAKKVVYSTCSVYPEENEDVVRQVVETCMNYKLVSANRFVKNQWTNFGSAEFGDIGNYCLYARPDIDLTSGFFVAVFERVRGGDKNPFLNETLLTQRIEGWRNNELAGKATKKRRNENVDPAPEETENVYEEIKREEVSEKKIKKEDEVSDTNVVSEGTTENASKKKKKKKKKKKSERSDDQIMYDDNKLQDQINNTEETNEQKKSGNVVKKTKKKHADGSPKNEFINTDIVKNEDDNHKRKTKKKEKKDVVTESGNEKQKKKKKKINA